MAIKDKFNKLRIATDARERVFRKEITGVYKQILEEVVQDLALLDAKGALTRTEIYKFSRFKTLSAKINRELGAVDKLNKTGFAKYVGEQYRENYFGSGYIMETEYQIKLAYNTLNKATLKAAISNPMASISLEDNARLVRSNIKRAITSSMAQGESLTKTAHRVKIALEGNVNKAFRIAQTETTRAANQGVFDTMVQSIDRGLPIQKQWVATLDDDTRDRHSEIDGQIRDVDSSFGNGLDYPGDPTGPPEEVINCRCTMITVVRGFGTAQEYRRARGTDGENEVIPYKTFDEWQDNRVSKN